MTNYNERLDEVLNGGIENIQEGVTLALRAGQNIDYHTSDARVELKQAIISLIKELVAEAKPTNSETQRGGVTVYGDLNERDMNIINQFEQNLLKALEEV